jgi:hypothetical protein
MRHHAQGQEQIAEGLEMPGIDLRKFEVVKHVPAVLPGRLGPGDPRLDLDGASVGPKAEMQRRVRLDVVVQLHQRAALTEVAGPAHPELALGGRDLVKERELNLVPGQSA